MCMCFPNIGNLCVHNGGVEDLVVCAYWQCWKSACDIIFDVGSCFCIFQNVEGSFVCVQDVLYDYMCFMVIFRK